MAQSSSVFIHGWQEQMYVGGKNCVWSAEFRIQAAQLDQILNAFDPTAWPASALAHFPANKATSTITLGGPGIE